MASVRHPSEQLRPNMGCWRFSLSDLEPIFAVLSVTMSWELRSVEEGESEGWPTEQLQCASLGQGWFSPLRHLQLCFLCFSQGSSHTSCLPCTCNAVNTIRRPTLPKVTVVHPSAVVRQRLPPGAPQRHLLENVNDGWILTLSLSNYRGQQIQLVKLSIVAVWEGKSPRSG